jgi:hypothetical protein
MPMFNNGETVWDAFNNGVLQEEAYMGGKQVFKNIVPWLVGGFEYTGESYHFDNIGGTENIADGLIRYDDGTSMYIVVSNSTTTGSRIWQYTLATPFDVTTAVFFGEYLPTESTNSLEGMDISRDGTKLYVFSRFDVYAMYDLSTPWDITTAVYSGQVYNDPATIDVTGGRVSADGTRYIMATKDEDVIEYEMSTPFDISTSAQTGAVLNMTTKLNQTFGAIYADSEKYVLPFGQDFPSSPAEIFQYELSTPNDLSTASQVSALDTQPLLGFIRGLDMKSDGVTMWVWGNEIVYVYTAA